MSSRAPSAFTCVTQVLCGSGIVQSVNIALYKSVWYGTVGLYFRDVGCIRLLGNDVEWVGCCGIILPHPRISQVWGRD